MSILTLLLVGILALGGGVGTHYLEDRVLNPDFALINTPESFAPVQVTPMFATSPEPIKSAATATTALAQVEVAPVIKKVVLPAPVSLKTVDCGVVSFQSNETINNCFRQKFEVCEPAVINSVGINLYTIVGKLGTACRIKQKFLQAPTGLNWAGKEMTCSVNNKLSFDVAVQPVNLFNCSGLLYEVFLKPSGLGE